MSDDYPYEPTLGIEEGPYMPEYPYIPTIDIEESTCIPEIPSEILKNIDIDIMMDVKEEEKEINNNITSYFLCEACLENYPSSDIETMACNIHKFCKSTQKYTYIYVGIY